MNDKRRNARIEKRLDRLMFHSMTLARANDWSFRRWLSAIEGANKRNAIRRATPARDVRRLRRYWRAVRDRARVTKIVTSFGYALGRAFTSGAT